MNKKQGRELILAKLNNIPSGPGVYRMIDSKGKVLYVGKAKNLAKRLSQYTDFARISGRIGMMVTKVCELEIITTKSEAEALLLEANLIKNFQPRYNILLKDDKSFPYILVRRGHEYPQIIKHRGAKKEDGDYFGPFASSHDVDNTIAYLQKIFLVRPCSDNYFAARKRPCIQYQIKRCSAPCVAKIDREAYHKLIKKAKAFLSGKSEDVRNELIAEMNQASQDLEYEKAASLRDRIRALNSITAKQTVNIEGLGDVDAIAVVRDLGKICIQIFFFRGGQNFGNKSYFPVNAEDSTLEDIIFAFLGKFYQNNISPKEILVNVDLEGKEVIEHILSEVAKTKVTIKHPKSGVRLDIIHHAESNAKEGLKRKLKELAGSEDILQEVQELFGLPTVPMRIEVYDNSHIMGRHAVGAYIVAGPEGFEKSQYRKFNINLQKDLKGGDDYLMLKEVLVRRLKRLKESELEKGDEKFPDLLLIDGGKGHLSTAMQTLSEMGYLGHIAIVAIAKGAMRNSGNEQFFLENGQVINIAKELNVKKYLQIIRDEVHRFAISAHRVKRTKALKHSLLDNIEGIGPIRKKQLLNYFGSLQDIMKASIADLSKVANINNKLAEKIYNDLHQK